MRRFAVRFLVALLTFGIGVSLSLAFGLFKFSNPKFLHKTERECWRESLKARAAFITVDSHHTDPLKLAHLGSRDDMFRGHETRMRFLVRNNSDRTITGFQITANEMWDANSSRRARNLDWSASQILGPGEISTISLPREAEGRLVRVAKVSFQDGAPWINPRLD